MNSNILHVELLNLAAEVIGHAIELAARVIIELGKLYSIAPKALDCALHAYYTHALLSFCMHVQCMFSTLSVVVVVVVSVCEIRNGK